MRSAKGELRQFPTDHLCIAIRTTECSLVRNFLRPSNDANLVQRPHIGAEPSMYTQHPTIDDLREGTSVSTVVSYSSYRPGATYSSYIEIVKDLAAALPDICIAIFMLAFVCI